MIKLKIVDLPTPLGPNRPRTWPALISKLILSKIFLFPNERDKDSNFIAIFCFLKDLILNFFIIAISIFQFLQHLKDFSYKFLHLLL